MLHFFGSPCTVQWIWGKTLKNMLILTTLCLAYSSTASTRGQSRFEQLRLAGGFHTVPKQSLQLTILSFNNTKQIKVFMNWNFYWISINMKLTLGLLPTGQSEGRGKDDFSSVSLPYCSQPCTCLIAIILWLCICLHFFVFLCVCISLFLHKNQKKFLAAANFPSRWNSLFGVWLFPWKRA